MEGKIQLHIKVRQDVYNRLAAYAAKENRTVTNAIDYLLDIALKEA